MRPLKPAMSVPLSVNGVCPAQHVVPETEAIIRLYLNGVCPEAEDGGRRRRLPDRPPRCRRSDVRIRRCADALVVTLPLCAPSRMPPSALRGWNHGDRGVRESFSRVVPSVRYARILAHWTIMEVNVCVSSVGWVSTVATMQIETTSRPSCIHPVQAARSNAFRSWLGWSVECEIPRINLHH